MAKNKNKGKKIKNFYDEVFGEYSDFCEKCYAKGKCNGSCCYEQIKEKFEVDLGFWDINGVYHEQKEVISERDI